MYQCIKKFKQKIILFYLFNEKKIHSLQRQLNLKNNLTTTFTDLADVTFKINRVNTHLVGLANKICS